jgi:ribosome-associated heat shock protein Hsp15
MSDAETRVRVDKWLWAARFFKTRALAADAVDGGKVQVNGERVKPAKALKAGDRLGIRNGPYAWDIAVLQLSDRRGPAAEAQKLYEESADSRQRREELAAALKAERQANPFQRGRPTKRDRRLIGKIKYDPG